ncbi:MAG: hemerythrin family protein [Rhodospirillales bacterium]|jgi:hemerythrin
MPIVWREGVPAGGEVIDDDHNKLSLLVNSYEYASAKHKLFEFKTAFQGLMEYAAQHFEREKKLQLAISMHGATAHRQEHRELAGQLVEFNRSLDDSSKPRISIEVASRFLHDWIANHVLPSDVKMRPLLTGAR